LTDGWNTFGNTSGWSDVVSGWNTFGNTAEWQGFDGWNTFGNVSTFVQWASGWNTFGNISGWEQLIDGWNTFENIAGWIITKQGWNRFGNAVAWMTIDQGWNTFHNMTNIAPNGTMLAPIDGSWVNTTHPTLSVRVFDLDNDTFNTSFYLIDGTLLGRVMSYNNTIVNCTPSLQYNITYYWYFFLDDGRYNGTFTSANYSFSTPYVVYVQGTPGSTIGLVLAVCAIIGIPGLIIFMRKKRKDEQV
jgi:hypothetical protein